MDEVWDFAGQVVSFAQNNDWLEKLFPFGESPSLLRSISTHKISGILSNLQDVGVNSYNALLNSDGTPTALAYYYFDNPGF